MTFTLVIDGEPVPQGSKRIGRAGRGGRPILIDDNQKLERWRESAKQQLAIAWCQAWNEPWDGPIRLTLEFVMPRPKKPKHAYPSRGDLDKLQRAIFDAAKVAGLYRDDSQVTQVQAWKRWGSVGSCLFRMEKAT